MQCGTMNDYNNAGQNSLQMQPSFQGIEVTGFSGGSTIPIENKLTWLH